MSSPGPPAATEPTPDVRQVFNLPGEAGGSLEYVSAGSTASSRVFLFFPGLFGVATPPNLTPELESKNVHHISVTPPGAGNSVAPKGAGSLATWLPGAVGELLKHLGYQPNSGNETSDEKDQKLRLVMGGGSYGTLHAQLVFGSPTFPFAGNLVGLVLLGPFSNPRLDKTFNSGLTWANWLSVGWPGRYLPILRLASFAMKGQLATPEAATGFIRKSLFDTMLTPEKELYASWRARYGKQEGDLESSMGLNAFRSVQNGWGCFLGVNDELWSDWNFTPASVAGRGPVFVAYGKEDKQAPNAMAEWILASYPNTRRVEIGGGHLSALWELDSILLRVFGECFA